MSDHNTSQLETKLDKFNALMEKLIAIQLYRGGAKQQDIANNLSVSIGKVNSLVRGLKSQKDNG
jgi:transposase